jgi:mono/diheme cytochrome c family protein/glucose/arabinose dehydrogenase
MNKNHFALFALTVAALTAGWVALLAADKRAQPAAPPVGRDPKGSAPQVVATTTSAPQGQPITIIPRPANPKPRQTESFEPKFTINSPPAPALSPEEALRSFKLPPGLQIELAAAEPLVEIPICMAWDGDGRLWVVEMRSYMPDLAARGENEPICRVSILQDTDADGRYDKSTVFLDKLVLPRAIALVNGGALIGVPPSVIFAKDTDGDLKADEVKTVFTGFGVSGNPEHKDNGLMWGLDNWIYNAKSARRFKWTPDKWVESATSFRGQWGIAQDDYGRLFHNSNSDVLRVDVTPAEYLLRNPNLAQTAGLNVPTTRDQSVYPGRVNYGVNRGYKDNQLRPDGTLRTVTAACGPTVYRGDLLPPEYRGNVFVCEPSGNVVMRKTIKWDGLTPVATNPHGQGEFLTSTDERFRPVSLYTGPDGALYVVDIYHGILQHKTYVTPYLAKQVVERKLDQDNRRGRIYRIVPENRGGTGYQPVKLTRAPVAQLVDTLSHPNGWHRDTAQRLLVERNDSAATPLLEKLIAESTNPLAKIHALWTLHGTAKLTPETVSTALADKAPQVRTTAIRVAEQLLPADARENNGALFDEILALAEDPSPHVQLQFACTVSGVNKPDATAALSKVIKRNPADPYVRDAALSGLRGRELEFLESLLADGDFATESKDKSTLLATLASCVAHEAKSSRVQRLLDDIANLKSGWKRSSLLSGLAGDPNRKIRKPIQLAAEPRILVALRESSDARIRSDAARLGDVLIWPGKPGYKEVKIRPLSADEQARFEKGKTLYAQTCAACHQPNGMGQEGLAPPLVDSEWVEGQDARIVRIVLDGLRGPLSVNGARYDLEMPALEAAFDDEMIAAILTYVRREWDHAADPVTPKRVREIRAQSKGRDSQWTAKELEKLQ